MHKFILKHELHLDPKHGMEKTKHVRLEEVQKVLACGSVSGIRGTEEIINLLSGDIRYGFRCQNIRNEGRRYLHQVVGHGPLNPSSSSSGSTNSTVVCDRHGIDSAR